MAFLLISCCSLRIFSMAFLLISCCSLRIFSLSAFSLAASWNCLKEELVSTPDLAFEALALVGVVRGPVGVEVMLLLRLPQPLRAPLVLGPCGVLRSAPDWLWLLG